jgi:hypothetical protein
VFDDDLGPRLLWFDGLLERLVPARGPKTAALAAAVRVVLLPVAMACWALDRLAARRAGLTPREVETMLLLVLDMPGTGWRQVDGDSKRFDAALAALRRAVTGWSAAERRAAGKWAARLHWAANDNDDVRVPPKPDCVARLERQLEAYRG